MFDSELPSAPFDLRLGDSRDVLKTLPDNSIDSCVCDPPYALESIVKRYGGESAAPATADVYRRASAGFMGQAWDTGETAFDPGFWSEVWRVLKPGAHLLAFSGTRTYHRMACAIEDAGFEVRDQLAWMYGSGFPKSHNQAGEWEGWGTALKPAWEPICFARKPLIGTVAANLAEHRTGALNIEACRVPGAPAPTRFDPAVHAHDGYRMNATGAECAARASPLGRWPANVIHDGSAEVLACFPFDARPAAGGVRRIVKGASGADAAGNRSAALGAESRKAGSVCGVDRGDRGSAARFFYCAKASKEDREEGCDHLGDSVLARSNLAQTLEAEGDVVEAEAGGFNKARTRKNNHPTVKPTELMAYLCRLVTAPGGVVLDPFMGSGSTGKAAMLEGFRFIGIERDEKFMAIAEARVAFGVERAAEIAAQAGRAKAQLDLFGAE